ncbi:MBL fold metallo-hydrolase [uncultured Rhodoblastus sp.]|uniref:MBL fold metallo-hydrolase n=1 Tax=uncultured Rhodoblastus sp. TaxID=543037 RepID=UPI0025EAA547|nr:MBL fold metallo-hydrolase [uncultured Rhodoblastus sp.]
MRRFSAISLIALLASTSLGGAFAANAASLEAAAEKLGADSARTLEFSGAGHWFQFGQAPVPGGPWPQFDVSRYTATIDFGAGAEHVQIARLQTVDPARARPAPVEQKVDAWLDEGKAWNVGLPPNAAPDAAPVATPAFAAVEERSAEILATPQGFVKAALAHQARVEPVSDGLKVSFALGKHKFEGRIDAENRVEWVRTWIDTPVLGDTLVETKFKDYKDFGGVLFPAEITREEGGYPVLRLGVASAKLNGPASFAVPENIASAQPAPINVKCDKIGDNVLYLTGGTHHSIAVIEKDHIVLIEAPLNEERSLAVIKKLSEVVPGKPIAAVINSHVHFDHSGGLRTFVDLGATIVAQEQDKPYYEKAWANPRELNPDLLAVSKKPAKFLTYKDELKLGEGDGEIRIYRLAGSGHSDDLALIYLPQSKIAIEADAYTPAAVDAPAPKTPNPYAVNLYENIQKLNLDVEKIAGLHGVRVATLDDLRAYIGQKQAAR